MPVPHVALEFHKVERVLRLKGFGFLQHQGGFFQLNKPSATAARADGTPHREPLPGLISPQMQQRILTYARDEADAATHFIAVATQAVTDPVLSDEPVAAPPMNMDVVDRVIETIVENKLAAVVESLRTEGAKQTKAIVDALANMGKRIDELESGDDDEEPEAAMAPQGRPKPKPAAAAVKKGKGRKASWRKKQVAEPKPMPSGKPPEPPMDMGIG